MAGRETAGVRRGNTLDAADPWAAPLGTSSEENPGIRITLSEKVRELNYVNDPWKGQELDALDGPYRSMVGTLFALRRCSGELLAW